MEDWVALLALLVVDLSSGKYTSEPESESDIAKLFGILFRESRTEALKKLKS